MSSQKEILYQHSHQRIMSNNQKRKEMTLKVDSRNENYLASAINVPLPSSPLEGSLPTVAQIIERGRLQSEAPQKAANVLDKIMDKILSSTEQESRPRQETQNAAAPNTARETSQYTATLSVHEALSSIPPPSRAPIAGIPFLVQRARVIPQPNPTTPGISKPMGFGSSITPQRSSRGCGIFSRRTDSPTPAQPRPSLDELQRMAEELVRDPLPEPRTTPETWVTPGAMRELAKEPFRTAEGVAREAVERGHRNGD